MKALEHLAGLRALAPDYGIDLERDALIDALAKVVYAMPYAAIRSRILRGGQAVDPAPLHFERIAAVAAEYRIDTSALASLAEERVAERVVSLWRDSGQPRMNAPHVILHAPTGIEWGYHGAGPADCALSVLAHVLPLVGDGGPPAWREDDPRWETTEAWADDDPRWVSGVHTATTIKGVRVTTAAWGLHQAFKDDVVAALPRDGDDISVSDVRAWAQRAKHEFTLAE